MKSLFLKIIFCLLIWINTEGYLTPSFAFIPPDKKVEALLTQGNKSFKDGFYYQAIQFYQEALTLAPDHAYAHYQLAECYRNLFEYQRAKHHYQEVYQANKEAYPLSTYYLALMLKLSGDYARSVEYFDAFIGFAKKEKFQDKDHFSQQAHLEKEGSLFALQKTMKPKGEFTFIRLPSPVNTEYNDYAATIYHADSSIALTSTRNDTKGRNLNDQYGEYYSDHYLFTKNEADEWEDMSRQDNFTAINTNFSEGTGVFNQDKSIFYFTGCYQEGYCHIYKSELKNGKWQSPIPLSDKVNLAGYDSKQPGLSSEGDTLFFVSNRPGGYGMQDIWMSILSTDGAWQPPVNLGAGINTAQNELSPFYYPLENTLFFSSNGHKGYGGFDIFVTTFSPATANPASINLGQPFNSSKDDLYLSLGELKGYLSSNRGNTDGNFDIYTFNITANEAVLLSLQNDTNTVASPDYFSILQFFSKQDQQYFQQLPLEEKAKVKQFIEVQSFQKALSEKAVLNESLSFFYESLPTEEKNIIERLSAAQKNFLLNENQDVLLPEDQYYYENLPLEKKEKIQQIIEAHTFRKILQDETLNDPQLTLFYESLPLEDRERIDRAIAERKNLMAKSYQNNVTPALDDLFFYQTLPSEEKEKIGRMIAAKTFQKQRANHTEVQDEFIMAYEQLPLEEKQRIDRMANARRFATKTIEDEASPEVRSEQDYLNIGSLAISNPENITIEGKIVADGKPANSVKVSLVNGNNEKEKLATTNQEGEFTFFNVNYHKDQKILFDQQAGFMQLTQFALEELRVIVLQDTIIQETFDNIYFETDQYAINDSSKVILDSLASFHFKYPDVQIEISAYTDTTGGNTYNKQLSFKRASEAYTYLVNKGVDQTALYILPKGKEIPQRDKDLQYSRRIEFALHGIATSYNPTKEVYVISPKPDLKEIANKYNLALSKLMELNPHIKDIPAPFTPIRILANQND